MCLVNILSSSCHGKSSRAMSTWRNYHGEGKGEGMEHVVPATVPAPIGAIALRGRRGSSIFTLGLVGTSGLALVQLWQGGCGAASAHPGKGRGAGIWIT